MLCLNITCALYQTPEEEIFAYETAIKLWNTFLYDGNFLFYHSHIADIYRRLAQNHALLGNRKETLENLQKALFHAYQHDDLPKEEQHFTSIWVSEAASDPSHSAKNYTALLEK